MSIHNPIFSVGKKLEHNDYFTDPEIKLKAEHIFAFRYILLITGF